VLAVTLADTDRAREILCSSAMVSARDWVPRSCSITAWNGSSPSTAASTGLSPNSELGRLVSGHGFSRAAGSPLSEGFSPWPLPRG